MKNYHVFKGPFIKSNNKTSNIMLNLFIALLPIIVFSFYKNGIVPYINNATDLYGMFRPLILVSVGIISSFIIETLYDIIFLKKRKKDLSDYIKNSYSIFPGLFLSLVLPINTPISVLIIGCFIAVILGKMIYGGFGNNIFNPALIGTLFVITMYGSLIASNGGYLNNYEKYTISSATPLTNQSLISGIGTYDTLVKPYGSLLNFFTGMIPGSVGETSALLCLVAFIYLAFKKVIKYKIPLFYIGTVFIMTYIIGSLNGLGIWYPLFQILSGGLFFGAIFMATDPVTSPTTSFGQIIEGIMLGILTVIFRYLTSAPEGVMTSILTLNMLVFIIDKIGIRNNSYKKRKNIVLIILITLLLSISYYISTTFKTSNIDPNFNLINKVNKNYTTVYTVTQKGNGGLIKIEITLKDSKPIKYVVLEQNETDAYYSKVEESNYINKLINSDDVHNIDTVSGATISSTALKKALINVIELDD